MTDIEICNLALNEVGSYRIANRSESKVEARSCDIHYDTVRDAVLRDYDWAFARKYVELSLISDTTYGNWTYAYSWPSDCVCARHINNSADDSKIKFEVITDGVKLIICTDEEDAELVYTSRVQVENLFDPIFVEAFTFKLATRICQPLKASAELKTQLHKQYLLALGKAQAADAKQGTIRQNMASDLVDARL